MEQHTGYGAARYINAKLKELGVEKELPPQMFYTYFKKGYIKTTINNEGRQVATTKELDEWFKKYNEKRTANETAKEEKVALELAGK